MGRASKSIAQRAALGYVLKSSEKLLQKHSIQNNYFLYCRRRCLIFRNVFYYIVSLEPGLAGNNLCGCSKEPVPQCGCCDEFEFDGKDHKGKQFENECCCIFSRSTLTQCAVGGLGHFTLAF